MRPSLWFKFGELWNVWSYIYMTTCSVIYIYICIYTHTYIYINALANSVTLHLYLWYDFYNIVIKNKNQTTYIFRVSLPLPQGKNLGARLTFTLCLQFLRVWSFLHFSLLLWCPPIPTPLLIFLFSVLHWWAQFLRLLSFFFSPHILKAQALATWLVPYLPENQSPPASFPK